MKKLLFVIALVALFGAGGWWLHKRPANDAAPVAQATKSTGDAVSLKVGDTAPNFATMGALAGKTFDLNLDTQLEKGPLVLYFFPKVFTSGCTAEAHEFAERSADFAAMGAEVVGMSADDMAGLAKFSSEACRDKFAVAQATPEIIAEYGVQMAPDKPMTNRTSYVIGQDHKVKFVFSNLDYKDHVRLTLDAVKKLKAS